MAKETKSVKVHPDYEAECIAFEQRFGWELFNTQEVYNKDTHLENSFFTDTITSVTETTHYVKLTFQRETEKVSTELKQLERDFDNLTYPEEPRYWSKLFILGGFMIYVIPGIVMICTNKRKRENYEAEIANYNNRHAELMGRLDQIGLN